MLIIILIVMGLCIINSSLPQAKLLIINMVPTGEHSEKLQNGDWLFHDNASTYTTLYVPQIISKNKMAAVLSRLCCLFSFSFQRWNWSSKERNLKIQKNLQQVYNSIMKSFRRASNDNRIAGERFEEDMMQNMVT